MFVSARSVKNNKLHHSQTIRDYKKLQIRMKANEGKLEFVSNYLDDYFGTHVNAQILSSLAKIIIDIHGLSLDRLAKRNRSALLCWYAENWDKIEPVLKGLNLGKVQNNSLASDKQCLRIEDFKPISMNSEHEADPYSITKLLNFY